MGSRGLGSVRVSYCCWDLFDAVAEALFPPRERMGVISFAGALLLWWYLFVVAALEEDVSRGERERD